jgi:hypothetical protein
MAQTRSAPVPPPPCIWSLVLSFANSLIGRFFALLAAASLVACSPTNHAVDALDKAIGELGKPSADWYAVLGSLEKSLPQASKADIGNDLDRIAQRGLASSPPDGRCDSNLIRARVQQELGRIRIRLDPRNPPLTPEPLFPVICEPSPAIFDLDRCVSNVKLYGQDLDASALMLSITGVDGQSRTVNADFAGESGRLVTLDTKALKLGEDDAQIIVRSRDSDKALAVIDVVAPVRPPPAPVLPAVTQMVENVITHIEAKSFGENKIVTYGRKCSPGHQRSECSVSQLRGIGQCEPAWVDPTNDSNCRCRVQFKLSAFESVDCRIRLNERTTVRQQAAPKKLVCG